MTEKRRPRRGRRGVVVALSNKFLSSPKCAPALGDIENNISIRYQNAHVFQWRHFFFGVMALRVTRQKRHVFINYIDWSTRSDRQR